jgi:hypothetical protein
MDNPIVKKYLVDAILELRQKVERRLQANKYYVAMNKLDELLATIRPLEVIEVKTGTPEGPKTEPKAAPAPETGGTSEKVWTGLVQESVVEGEGLRAF